MEKILPLERLNRYSKEISDDLKINEVTLQDRCFEIPQRKHYWVAKLIQESQELNRLEREKKNLEKDALKAQNSETNLVMLSPTSLKKAIGATKPMQDINQLIEDQKLLVEYLQKTEKIFAYITNDVKNIIEIMQLQLL